MSEREYLEKIARQVGMTLEEACTIMGIKYDEFVEELEKEDGIQK